MAVFRISAFADEYSPSLDRQIEGLTKFGIDLIELRGVDGKSVADLTPDEAKEVKKKLDDAGIKLSAVGSPLGKIDINGDIRAHMDLTRRICETANIMECGRIRGFSFYGTSENPSAARPRVLEYLDEMIEICEGAGVLYCHENEKGIYGETPERCLDLAEYFGGRMGCVFDHANFIQSGCEPYPAAYEMLKNYITYMHIKDAEKSGAVVVAGEGIGRIPETLAELDKRDGEIILTLEPHLRVFRGLDALEHGERSKIKNAYRSAEEAFDAALSALRRAIEAARA